jgi:FtsZ-binding cell division protein ZapB
MPTKNIIVVSSPSLAASRARRGGADKNYSLWGGGSTTVVSQDGGSNGDVILAELECVPSVVKYKVNTENAARPRANKRKAEEELLDPEEDEKRSMRRDRNRLAAARCRQKRLDQIETLQVEVNNWEMKNRSLEEEVAALKADKEELQYILAAHRNTCSLQVKVEPVTEEEPPVFVEVQPRVETVKPQRPGSLSLPMTVNNIEGVSIETPSNGILSFNTLLEGKTGLTPTILSPTSLWGPIRIPSALNTPNCGSQERRLIVTDLLSPSTQALLTSL